jgi:hypothetical protein
MAKGSYWIGIVMTLLCLALVLSGNTQLAWGFEHRSFPLSWVFGCAAILAFLVCEYVQTADREARVSRLTPAWEPAESLSDWTGSTGF